MIIRTLILAAALVAPLAVAESPDPVATVDDLDWMVGRWVGEGLGGQIEEIIQAPIAGAMPSTFRLTRPDKVGFYEFILYENTNDGVQLLLHHFSPGMQRWEDEPVTFDLVELKESSALFAERDDEEEKSRLFYERTDNAMTAELIELRDGEDVVTARFRYTLAED